MNSQSINRFFILLIFTSLSLFQYNNLIYGQLSPISNWTRMLSENRPSTGTWEDHNPEIEYVGNTVHFFWFSLKNDFTRGVVYYRNSTDGGKTLNPVVVIKDTTGDVNPFSGLTNTKLKRMTIDGNNVHIAYKYNDQIFYSHSTNNGLTFSKPISIFSLGGIANYDFADPYISCSGNTIAVGYTEMWGEPFMGAHWYDGVSVAVSTDNGATFKRTRITKFAEWTWSYLVDVIQANNRIHALITTANDDITQVGVATSADGGTTYKTTWLTDVLLTKANSLLCSYENSYESKIAVAGNNIYVVWVAKDIDGVSKLFICRSINNGSSYETPVAVTNSSDSKYGGIYRASVTVAAKGNNVYIAYAKENNYDKVYVIRSTDSGVSYSTPIDMISDGNIFQNDNARIESVNPSIKFSPSDQAGTDVYLSMNRPKFRHSTDGFKTLGTMKIVDLFFNYAFRQRTKLAVDQNGTAHFVYEYQLEAGNYEDRRIYYRSFPLAAANPSSTNMSLAFETTETRWDNMQIPSCPELCFSSALSIELWVKPTVGSGKDKMILFKEAYSSDGWNQRDGFGIFTEDNDGRRPYAMITTTGQEYAYRINSNTKMIEGAWSHLAITYDANGGTKNFKLYLNGNLVASTTAVGNISPYQFEGPIWIGGRLNQFSVYRGEVDELRFWNIALTKEEIAANMNKQLVGNENDLVTYYNFNNTTKDITGKGNDGILMYQETFVPSNPVGIETAPQIPAKFTLYQNYPNPFNPTTKIKYDIPAPCIVRLSVYDVLGREVKSLVNGYKEVGSHEIDFNATGFPSGVYFYRLMSEQKSITRKLMLLR